MLRLRSRSDAELIVASGSEPAAFGEFYRRHERAVLRYFLYWTRSADLSADLMAETFAVTLESRDRYQPDRGEARAWLFGIARNVLLRSARRGRVEDATRQRLGLAPVEMTDDALERVVGLASGRAGAIDALSSLSTLLREAVTGRVIDEREYREMAESMSCSESVVRQRVRRGLQQIREHLEVTE